MSTWETVRLTVEDRIAWVELHRPDKPNDDPTLNREMVEVLQAVDADEDAGVLVLTDTVSSRDALWYIMTGETFDGPRAAEMGLVNRSLPLEQLREQTTALAEVLPSKNPVVLDAAKNGFRHAAEMSWENAQDYLYAMLEQSQFQDREGGRKEGLSQFLDEKTIRPGLQAYER